MSRKPQQADVEGRFCVNVTSASYHGQAKEQLGLTRRDHRSELYDYMKLIFEILRFLDPLRN